MSRFFNVALAGTIWQAFYGTLIIRVCSRAHTSLLLRLKGFVAVATSTMENLELMLEHWKPRTLLIDAHLCHADDTVGSALHAFIRARR